MSSGRLARPWEIGCVHEEGARLRGSWRRSHRAEGIWRPEELRAGSVRTPSAGAGLPALESLERRGRGAAGAPGLAVPGAEVMLGWWQRPGALGMEPD